MRQCSVIKTVLLLICVALPGTALADIVISDAYARISRPNAPTAAAFMEIENTGTEDDRLISVRSDAAARVELHTHIDKGEGIMQMVEVEEGFVVPAQGKHALARGGDHVMFMGVTEGLENGSEIDLVLTFEKAGEITLTVPVDNDRKGKHSD